MIKKHKSLMSIADVSANFDFSFRALRYYESRGLIQPIRLNRQRAYDNYNVARVSLIKQGKKFHFSLAEIESIIGKYDPSVGSKSDLLAYLSGEAILRQLDWLRHMRAEVSAALIELQPLAKNEKADKRLNRQTGRGQPSAQLGQFHGALSSHQ